MSTSRRATRARSRLTDGEDVAAPGTDPGSPVLAPASPQQETSCANSCANRERADVLFQIAYTTSVVVRMVGIDGRALARDYSLRPVLG